MDILKNIGLLLLGFVLLVKGADFFVEGSSSVAKRLRIPSIIVGLTIVAMGTSLPELSVSLTAALNQSNEIAISNVIGSNIFNLIVVLGACAIISPVIVDKKILKFDYPVSIIIVVALIVMTMEKLLFGKSGYEQGDSGTLGRIDGIIFLIAFVSFMIYTVMTALKERKNSEEEQEKMIPVVLCIVYIVGGIAAIKFGGDFVVEGAKAVALKLGMTETLVGLTIVAVGTSLPELVTSVVAARKGETGLAIGNVIGSNIFNVVFILGTSATICPITMSIESIIDAVVLTVANVLVYIFAKSRDKIERKEGICMIIIYISYMVYAIIR